MSRLILPDDFHSDEGLRKSLANIVRSPADREFERLKAEGFDSETAASLAGLDDYSPEHRAEVILRASGVESYVVASHNVARTAQGAMANSLTSVGSSAGAQVGSAISAAIMRGAVKNAQSLSVAGTVIVGCGVAYASAKIVGTALGTGAAIAAAAGSIVTASLIAMSLWKRMA